MPVNVPVDTSVVAPARPSDKWALTLMDALDKCLNTEAVQTDIGADFVPEELVAHGELWVRYLDLQSTVRSALDLPRVK